MMKSHGSIRLYAFTLALLAGAGNAQNYTGEGLPMPAGSAARAILVDVNNDGMRDIVYFSRVSFTNHLAVDIATGGGQFASPIVDSNLIGYTSTFACADVTGDGIPDAVVVNDTGKTVVPFGGVGNGNFTMLASYTVFDKPTSIAFADFDLDGLLDAAVTCNGSNCIVTLRNTGGGFFVVSGPGSSGLSPFEVKCADIDSDGAPDCVTANTTGTISYYQNAGTGNFFASIPYFATSGAKTLIITDFDFDGKQDVLVGGASSVVYMQGIAGGPFAAPVVTAIPPVSHLYNVDFDGNNQPDVLGTNGSQISIAIGLGGSNFSVTGFGAAGADVALGLVNGDALPDLVVSDPGLFLYPMSGVGQFKGVAGFAVPLSFYGLALRDLDHDGTPELIGGDYNGKKVLVYKWNGSTFNSFTSANVGNNVSDLAIRDLNNDGIEDYAAGNLSSSGRGLTVGFGLGNGNFGAAVPVITGTNTFAAVNCVDSNNDGNCDILLATGLGASLAKSILNNGSGGFTTVINIAANYPRDIVPADFNNDGNMDVMLIDYSSGSAFVAYLNFGNGTGAYPGSLPPIVVPGSLLGRSSAVYDYDADGSVDAIFRTADKFVALRNVSFGSSFTTTTLANLSVTGGGIIIKDMNGDGIPDLTTSTWNASVAIANGAGSGSFAAPKYYQNAAYGSLLASADIDGDGRPDIIVTTNVSGNSGVSFNLTMPAANTAAYGTDTRGCFGKIGLATNSAPAVGNLQFAFVADNAPRNLPGLLLVTDSQGTGNDPFGLGIQLWVDLFAALEIYGLDMPADAGGAAFAPAPIPNNPSLSGNQYYAQGIFLENDFERCSASPLHLAASAPLHITIP
ncbi:MAG: VCBS repeat-containing protein [Planctomycetes bacterium]|nr:VCBS repeat-containing protein [Planctomycetota bacterium]